MDGKWCKCAMVGMDVQKAVSDIEEAIAMTAETGASIRRKFEREGLALRLVESLRDAEKQCNITVPVEVYKSVEKLEEEAKYDDEVRIGPIIKDVEERIRSTFKEACK